MSNEITAFISTLEGGGAQGVFVTVMNYYVSNGLNVTVVVGNLNNDIYSCELSKKISIQELKADSSKKSLFKILDYIRNNTIELAFAFSPEMAVNLVIARKVTNKHFPIIGRCINTLSMEYGNAEGFFRREISSRLIKFLYYKIDQGVAQSTQMKVDLVNNYKFKNEQVCTINNPLSDKYEKELFVAPKRNRDNNILFVGRFEKQKGLDMLIEAFSKIKDREVRLLLFGDGSQKMSLIQVAKKFGVDNRIDIHPFDKNIIDRYRSARLTVMSSIFEGFPNVLSESIACGTPVVSYDLPSGPSDIVINDVNGYLSSYLNTDDLAKCIDKALKKEWDYVLVKKSAERFSKNNILPQYKELIDKWSF